MRSKSSGSTCSTWWLVPKRRATTSAWADSLKAGSPKEMEQVFTGSLDNPAIMATTAEESTPPDRKAPSGTSEISRISTASRRRSRSSCSASAGSCTPLS